MKKNLTKLVSILMVLVMMVGLSGCSNEKNAVLGSWKASMNLAEYLNQGIAQEDATAAEYLSVDSFYLTMVLTFKEDNTYTITLDENSVDAAVEQLKTDIRGGMERYLVDMMAQMGVVMTIDEIMKASNTTMDKLMDEFFSDEMVEQYMNRSAARGFVAGMLVMAAVSPFVARLLARFGGQKVVMGGTLLIGICFVLINNLTDLLVRLTDPRVR